MLIDIGRDRRNRIALGIGALLIAASFAVLIARALRELAPYDLGYILTAGRMWLAGLDPYGPDYAIVGADYFIEGAGLWAYPPQWWLISAGLGALNDIHAILAWKFVNIAALIGGGLLLQRAASHGGLGTPLWASVLFWALLATGDPTKTTMQLGQTSLLMLLGFALLVHGMTTNSLAQKAAGLAILLLKPQYGLFFLALTLADRTQRRAAFTALAVTALACLPFLFQQGLSGAITSAFRLLDNVAAYGDLRWNRPLEVNGLTFLSALIGGPRPPALLLVFAAILGAWSLRAWLARDRDRDHRAFWLASLSVFFLAVPLHYYDLTLVPSFLLLVHILNRWAAACVVVANLILWRASTLAFGHFKAQESACDGIWIGSLLQSAAATLIAILLIIAVLTSSNPSPSTGEGDSRLRARAG